MWELDCKEIWAPKNWCFWTVVLEKTLESPLDCKEIQPVHSEGNQSLIFIGRTDVEAETPILWPPDVKNWLTGKDPDAGQDWWEEEKGIIEDEIVGLASPTRWTWVWAGSGSWWWTGKPGMLQSMGSQRVGHDWVTELNWTSQVLLKGSCLPRHFRGCPLLWNSSLSPNSWLSMRWPGPGAARQTATVAHLTLWMAQLLLFFSLVVR